MFDLIVFSCIFFDGRKVIGKTYSKIIRSVASSLLLRRIKFVYALMSQIRQIRAKPIICQI